MLISKLLPWSRNSRGLYFSTVAGFAILEAYEMLPLGRFGGLSTGKHDEQMNVVAVLNRFGEFIGVCAGMIDVDFNDV